MILISLFLLNYSVRYLVIHLGSLRYKVIMHYITYCLSHFDSRYIGYYRIFMHFYNKYQVTPNLTATMFRKIIKI